MKLSNLHTRGDKYQDTLSLIERSFGYKSSNSFETDFYPLMRPENRRHCWILEERGRIVAHSGALQKLFKVAGQSFPVLFIGGVAVDENERGKGHSSTLLKHIFKTYPHNALYILWSEKIDMYKKYGFQPCIELFEHPVDNGGGSFAKSSLEELSSVELQTVKALYESNNQNTELRIHRNEEDWEGLKKIKSADLYIKKDGQKIINYFFMNKGQDLAGIIHEYGHLKDIKEMQTYGKLWASEAANHSQALFGSLVKPGEKELFKKLVKALSGIKVLSINDYIKFKYEGEVFSLTPDEFLQGLFGPGRFQELDKAPKLFISGLDSI